MENICIKKARAQNLLHNVKTRKKRFKFDPRALPHREQRKLSLDEINSLAVATNGNCGLLLYQPYNFPDVGPGIPGTEIDLIEESSELFTDDIDLSETNASETVDVETTALHNVCLKNHEGIDITCNRTPVNEFGLISPPKQQPVGKREIFDRSTRIKKKLSLSSEEIKEVEQQTRMQSKSARWEEERRVRITASKCHRIAKMKQTTSPTKAAMEILHFSRNIQTKAMKEGLEREGDIRELYMEHMETSRQTRVNVDKCSLLISPSHGFLGASPDGLVFDAMAEDPNGLLEMKYISLKPDETLTDALIYRKICFWKDGTVTLITNHSYYYQIQQQMFVAQRKWNDFVVNGGQELFVQQVFSMLHFGKVFCLNWNNFLTKSLLQNLHIHDLNMGSHDYILINKSPSWHYFLLAVYPADRIEHLSKCIIIEHQLCRSVASPHIFQHTVKFTPCINI